MSDTTSLTRKAPSSKDYGYSNARVRGMRSRLLSRTFVDSLIGTKDMDHVIQMLSQTEYGADLEGVLLHGHTAAAVDEALKHNTVRTFRKVLGLVNDEAHVLVTTLLGRWDLFNVKTIVRGKHMHVSPEEIIEGLLPVAQLTQVDVEELSKVPDVRAVVDTLTTWGMPFAAPLRASMGQYAAEGDMSTLELALDRYYSEWAANRIHGRGMNRELARRFLGVQVDTINLLTVLRLQKADTGEGDIARFFLPGGLSIGEDLFVQLAELSDVDQVFERLKYTPYGRPLEDVAVAYVEANSIAVFERALEDYLTRRALVAGTGDPLGVGVIISYLWAKINEVTNLRIIVKGVSVGMPEERMRKELILV